MSKAHAPSRDPKAADRLRVLVIDDEPFHAETVAESLERVGYECVVASSGSAGAKKIEKEDFDVILTDLRMEDMDGLAILRKAKQELPDAEVVVITGHGDVKTAVEAIKEGAANYLTKPVDLGELRAIVDKVAERLRLARANLELKRQIDEKFGFEGVVGNSPKMHEVLAKLRSIAPTSATVLIQGETGTGKELVAKAIHTNSPRKAKPFEHANGGTLFLDEVGDMPLALQAKLLRVLENQEVFRIGSNEAIKVNVRLLSASNRDLETIVEEGKFRRDLYFRLKVVTINLPPLRDRREDIPLLTAHFIKEFNERHGKKVMGVAEPLRKALARYDWPGNVRELRNVIESMVVQDQDDVLNLDDLQEGDGLRKLQSGEHAPDGPGGLVGRPLNEVERYYIEKTLEKTEGNREEAAKMLGIGERTLYRNIQDWKVQDKIREALAETNGNVERAASKLEMSVPVLQRKIKKLGIEAHEEAV